MPSASKIVDRSNVNSSPNLRATTGANGDTTANASNGIVVKKPASTLEIPSPSRIKEMDGPTAVSGKRKVDALDLFADGSYELFGRQHNLMFGGLAGTAAGAAKIVFVVGIILFLVSLFMGRKRP